MKKMLSNLRWPIIWVIGSLLLYILLAIVVMFSRQITLDGVRGFDFDLISKSLTTLDEKTLDKNFKYLADTLTLDDGKTIFFPLALLYNNKCIENGSRNDSLCSKFSNIDSFKTATKNIKPINTFV